MSQSLQLPRSVQGTLPTVDQASPLPFFRAPGKVVLSGAYAILYGAPAIVASADRYVYAALGGVPPVLSAEVAEILPTGEPAPWFDATELREADRKLGLGSSSAILLASFAALRLSDKTISPQGVFSPITDEDRDALFPIALEAHRRAQGGGSGIDVAVACYGALQRCELSGEILKRRSTALPQSLNIEVWASTQASKTSGMLRQLRQYQSQEPKEFEKLMVELCISAQETADAIEGDQFQTLISAYQRQAEALLQLGKAASMPIFTEDLRELHLLAKKENVVLMPAGAGGGDINLWIGEGKSSEALRLAAAERGILPLDLKLGGPGLSALPALPFPVLSQSI